MSTFRVAAAVEGCGRAAPVVLLPCSQGLLCNPDVQSLSACSRSADTSV